MNILSLFDGISCGQLALDRAKIPYNNYYSSEIDKYCLQITQKNYPNTIQLGDIYRWRDWKIEKPFLIMGGFPCQPFSFAGNQKNFSDPRGRLFFKLIDVLNHYKPRYFLFENTQMKKECKNIVSRYLKVEPIVINSDQFICQNRVRLYWTNIKIGKLPPRPDWKEKYFQKRIMGIRENKKGVSPCLTSFMKNKVDIPLLLEILENGVVDRDCSYAIDANYFKGTSVENYFEKSRRQIVFTEIRTEEAKLIRKEYKKKYNKDHTPFRAKELVPRKDGKCGCLGTTLHNGNIILDEKLRFRKLTPIECERLQTIPDNYTEGVSNTQRYKMIGNSWTVDVIAFILKHMKYVI